MFAQPHYQRNTFTRLVGWVLLVFIIYGTTAEAAHQHGRVVPTTSSAESVTQTSNLDGSAGTKSSCNDCLICQLHQNVSATLLSLKLHTATSDSQVLAPESAPTAIYSRVNTPRSGRAPPQIN